MVTNQQLYLAIGVPMLFNAAMLGLVTRSLITAHWNARFDAILTAASTTCATSGAPNSAASKRSSTPAYAT